MNPDWQRFKSSGTFRRLVQEKQKEYYRRDDIAFPNTNRSNLPSQAPSTSAVVNQAENDVPTIASAKSSSSSESSSSHSSHRSSSHSLSQGTQSNCDALPMDTADYSPDSGSDLSDDLDIQNELSNWKFGCPIYGWYTDKCWFSKCSDWFTGDIQINVAFSKWSVWFKADIQIKIMARKIFECYFLKRNLSFAICRSKRLVQSFRKMNSANDIFCAICQQSVEFGEDINILKCQHIFHSNCVTQHL